MGTRNDSSILEQGNVYFLYRPKIEEEHPRGMKDVERFYILLSPEGKRIYREIVIGRKQLPRNRAGGERNWGFVKMVVRNPKELEGEFQETEYPTKTRGKRHLPAARPAGEGVYAIVRHEGHTHLVYSLELPHKPAAVQHEFRIEEQGSYVISVKNPDKPSPRNTGLAPQQKADYPQRLLHVFRERRFADADPPDLLDYEGTELLLIGTGERPADAGAELEPQRETESSADIFKDLKLNREKHPVQPLFEGRELV